MRKCKVPAYGYFFLSFHFLCSFRFSLAKSNHYEVLLLLFEGILIPTLVSSSFPTALLYIPEYNPADISN